MKVEVEKINETGTVLQEDIRGTQWDMDSIDVQFPDDIHLVSTFQKVGQEIRVITDIQTQFIITCSRCLERVKKPLEKHVQLVYTLAGLGQYLEIDGALREELLLDFPMKVLCGPGCKGICPLCGINLNHASCNCQPEKINLKGKLKI